MAKTQNHAPFDTLLGQLQRGRGVGYLAVLSEPKPKACEILTECITNDPRLDSQVEERSEYYASIAVEIGYDLAPLAKHLRDHDDQDQNSWNTPLTIGTLGELARRNFMEAAEILCDYVSWGQWWNWNLDDLMACPNPNLQARVARAIELRFPSDSQMGEAVSNLYLDDASKALLLQHSKRISKFAGEENASSAKLQSGDKYGLLTPKQLLEIANEENHAEIRKAIVHVISGDDASLLMQNVSIERPYVTDVALAGLAKLAPVSVLKPLLNFWSDNPEWRGFPRGQFRKVFVSFPSKLTLPIARERLFHERPNERWLAEHILKKHATDEDVSLLRRAIRKALSDDEENLYRICNMVEAFLRLPNIGTISELSDVFLQLRYSYGRWLAAGAINVTAPGLFRDTFATECLWDCESSTRSLGAEFAPWETTDAQARLQTLAASDWEEKSVRESNRIKIKS